MGKQLPRPVLWGLVIGSVGIAYSLITSWLAFGPSSSLDAIFVYYDPVWLLIGGLVRAGVVSAIWVLVLAPFLHFVAGFLIGCVLGWLRLIRSAEA